MCMQDAVDLRSRHVAAAVEGDAGVVDAIRAIIELVAAHIDLDEARRGDFVEPKIDRLQQKVVGLSWNTCREMRAEVRAVPTEMIGETIAGGEFNARIPLFRADPFAQRRQSKLGNDGAHMILPELSDNLDDARPPVKV